MLGKIFSRHRATPPQLLRYYSTVDFAKINGLPKIFTESKSDFESHLEYFCDIIAKDSVREDLFSAIKDDLGTRITNLEKTEFSAARHLEHKYEAHLDALYKVLSGKFAIEGEDQKTIPINILGTQLSLVTLFNNVAELGQTQVLSSFLCYKGFPIGCSANASSLALSDNNRNIHHFALGELPEKIPTMQEYALFGDRLVMTLVQRSLPLLVGNKMNLGYQRISCQSKRSLAAQNDITAQKEIRGIAESYSSNFPRIYQFSKASLEQSASDISKVRSDIDPYIAVGFEKIAAIPRRDVLLREIDRVTFAENRPLWIR